MSGPSSSHRNWFGMVLKRSLTLGLAGSRNCDKEAGTVVKAGRPAEGSDEGSQVCRFSCRGVVLAVPDSFSVYRPEGHFCDELFPTGSAQIQLQFCDWTCQ